jgi:hypothetical protein
LESNAFYQFLIKKGKTNAKVESFRCLLLSTEISKNDVTIYLFSNYKDFLCEFLKMIDNIYSDRMSLVVELNLDDVTDVSGVFTFPALQKLEDLKLIAPMPTQEGKEKDEIIQARKDLYSALLLKDNVGFFIWFLLIGIFCILVSTNTILSSNCSPKLAKNYSSIFNTAKA